MAFCVNCGTKIEENIKFCPECGTAVGGAAEAKNEDAATNNAPTNSTPTNSAPTAEGFDPKDVETNKAMGILAYIIFFIPLIAAKDSAFAKYHANQGFGCFIGFVISSVLWIIPILGWILAPILYIVFVAFSIMGIINAVNGKAKALPVIGKFNVFK